MDMIGALISVITFIIGSVIPLLVHYFKKSTNFVSYDDLEEVEKKADEYAKDKQLIMESLRDLKNMYRDTQNVLKENSGVITELRLELARLRSSLEIINNPKVIQIKSDPKIGL